MLEHCPAGAAWPSAEPFRAGVVLCADRLPCGAFLLSAPGGSCAARARGDSAARRNPESPAPAAARRCEWRWNKLIPPPEREAERTRVSALPRCGRVDLK